MLTAHDRAVIHEMREIGRPKPRIKKPQEPERRTDPLTDFESALRLMSSLRRLAYDDSPDLWQMRNLERRIDSLLAS